MKLTEDDVRVLCSGVLILAALVFMAGMAAQLQLKAILAFFWDSGSRRCRCFAPIVVGLVAQIVLNPLAGGLVISFFTDLDRRMRIAAMIIMCSSSGMGSNLMSYVAYGNFEASVVLTACSTLLTGVTFPTAVLLSITKIWKLDDEGTDFPYGSFAVSVLVFILPICFGVLLQRRCPPRILRRLGAVGIGSGLFFLLAGTMMYMTDEEARESLLELGSPSVFLLSIILNAVGYLVGYAVGWLCRFPEEHCRMLLFEVGAQNVALPLGVITITFPSAEQHVYVTMLFAYSIVQVSISLPFALAFRFFRPLPDVIQRRQRLSAIATAAASAAEPPGSGSESAPADQQGEDPPEKTEKDLADAAALSNGAPPASKDREQSSETALAAKPRMGNTQL